MTPKELIKADPETFWRWIRENPISHPEPVYISPDNAKATYSVGKKRGPAS